MKTNRFVESRPTSSSRWGRESVQRFRNQPPWMYRHMKSTEGADERQGVAAYQAVRYSEASEEQFLGLMRRAAMEADSEEAASRGLFKQEGFLHDEDELRDMEFEELDRRAADVLEKSAQVLRSSTSRMRSGARISDSKTEAGACKVKVTRTMPVAAASRTSWERGTGGNTTTWIQEEDDMAAAALSSAMSFLVHSVRDGAVLDEWLITNDRILSRLSENHEKPCANASTVPSTSRSTTTSNASLIPCARNAQGGLLGLDFTTQAIAGGEAAAAPLLAPSSPNASSARASTAATRKSDMLHQFPANSTGPFRGSDLFLSPGVNSLILEVIQDLMLPDGAPSGEDFASRKASKLSNSGDSTLKQPATRPHDQSSRLSSKPPEITPVAHVNWDHQDDQDTVNYLDSSESN